MFHDLQTSEKDRSTSKGLDTEKIKLKKMNLHEKTRNKASSDTPATDILFEENSRQPNEKKTRREMRKLSSSVPLLETPATPAEITSDWFLDVHALETPKNIESLVTLWDEMFTKQIKLWAAKRGISEEELLQVSFDLRQLATEIKTDASKMAQFDALVEKTDDLILYGIGMLHQKLRHIKKCVPCMCECIWNNWMKMQHFLNSHASKF